MTQVESWNATGLVSLTLITVIIIKLFSIAIAYSDLVKRPSSSLYIMLNQRNIYNENEINYVMCLLLHRKLVDLFASIITRVKLDKSIGRQVDMSGDWSYLIEFGFGVILIAIVIGIELFVIMRTLTAVAIVAAVFGTFLSSVNIKQNVIYATNLEQVQNDFPNKYSLSDIIDGSSPEYEYQFLVVGEKANQRMHVSCAQAVHAVMVCTNRGETTRDNNLQ